MSFTFWRLNISANAGDSSFLQITELQMRSSVGGANQATGGTATASSSATGFEANKALDGDTATRWSTDPSGTVTGWWQYEFAAPIDIVQLTVTSGASAQSTRAPRDFTIECSNNGTDWTVVGAVLGQTGWGNFETRTFTFAGSTEVRATQLAVEVIRKHNNPPAFLTQMAVEVLRQEGSNSEGRLTQLVVEVIRREDGPPPPALSTQAMFEVFSSPVEAEGVGRSTQALFEVMGQTDPDGLSTAGAFDVLWEGDSPVRSTQAAFEVLWQARPIDQVNDEDGLLIALEDEELDFGEILVLDQDGGVLLIESALLPQDKDDVDGAGIRLEEDEKEARANWEVFEVCPVFTPWIVDER